MKDKSIQWVVADKGGNKREGAYETEAEASVALERMRLAAVKTKNDAQARASEGRPWYADEDNLKAVENFNEREWRVKSESLYASVYRLNADIAQDADFLREVLWKLRVCGEVRICWTCIGHTRAEMQGEATAAFLKKYGYSAKYILGGDVVVKAGKEVR